MMTPPPALRIPLLPRPRAWGIAARVAAPGRRGVTLADLGILHDVIEYDQGDVHVQILTAADPRITADAVTERLVRALTEEGFRRVDVEHL